MSYIPVVILFLAGALVAGVVMILTSCLGAGRPNFHKKTSFECGVPSLGSAHQRFSVRFYLIAILFLLFDVEVVFLFPWAMVLRKFLAINTWILIEMGFFFLVLLVGYWYVIRKGALEWE